MVKSEPRGYRMSKPEERSYPAYNQPIFTLKDVNNVT